MSLTDQEARKLACWINRLEIAVEDAQSAVTDFFTEPDGPHRRRLLEIIQRQLWSDRPADEIHKLLNKQAET